MAKYTTELRTICQFLTKEEKVELSEVDRLVNIARPKIFDFEYDFADKSYKEIFEKKFLYHFFTREIGHETYGLWKLKLQTKLQEIIPKYNKMYEAESIKFNPFHDTDLTTMSKNTDNSQNKGTSKLNSASESTNKGRNEDNGITKIRTSETPAGIIDQVESDRYMSNYTSNQNDSVVKSEQHGNSKNLSTGDTYSQMSSTSDYVQKIQGKSSGTSMSRLLVEYRESLINIDLQIFDELEELFMQLW